MSSSSGRSALLLAITGVNAACFVAIDLGLAAIPPLRFAGLRLLVGGMLLLFLLPLFRAPILPHPGSWRWLLPLAIVGGAFSYGAMFLTPTLTRAGIASVLGNTQPLIVLVLARFFLGERITRAKGAALVFGIVGVVAIATPSLRDTTGAGLSGALLALASAAGLSTGSILIKAAGDRLNLLNVTAWQLILGAVPLLLVSALLERDLPTDWTPRLLGILLFLAVAGTAFATAAWYWLVRQGDLGRLSMFFFLVPLFGLILSTLLLGEPILPIQGIGAGLVVAGIAVLASERA